MRNSYFRLEEVAGGVFGAVMGNQVFVPDAVVISTANTRERLRIRPLFQQLPALIAGLENAMLIFEFTEQGLTYEGSPDSWGQIRF